jgi:DNA-binding transcriptional ArsR family regulator
VVNQLDAMLDALADPTRRRVIELLRERPRPATALATGAGTSGPAMSRHLRVLRTTGLVEEQRTDRDARVRVYRLRQEPFLALRAWLDEVETFWTGQLHAYRAHVERTRGAKRQ